MPSNRRSHTSGQSSVRRPKVAGLRKRDKTEPEQTEQTSEETAESTVATEEPTVEAPEPAADAAPEAAETESAESDTEQSESSDDAVDEAGSEELAEDQAAEDDTESEAKSESIDEDDSETKSESEATAEDGSAGGDRAKFLWGATAVLLVVAVICAVMGYKTYFTGPMSNQALINAGETSQVKGQVEDGIQKIFSYDFNDTKKTEDAAHNILVGSAVAKYNDLFAVVKQQAPQQQLIVTTTVKSSSVTQLQGNEAQLLVFVDQHALRSSTGESNVGPAQLSVSAEKQGDQWKITGLTIR